MVMVTTTNKRKSESLNSLPFQKSGTENVAKMKKKSLECFLLIAKLHQNEQSILQALGIFSEQTLEAASLIQVGETTSVANRGQLFRIWWIQAGDLELHQGNQCSKSRRKKAAAFCRKPLRIMNFIVLLMMTKMNVCIKDHCRKLEFFTLYLMIGERAATVCV